MDYLTLMNSLQETLELLAPLLTRLLSALLIILAGFLLAKAVGFMVSFFLKSITLEKGIKQIGLNFFLEKGEVRKSISDLIGDLFYWIILFITLIGSAQFFGLPVKEALEKIFSFTGLTILAAVILGIGLFLASLLAAIVKVIALNFGIDGAKTLSRVIYYILVIFSFLAALSELGIKSDVFIPQIGVIIGAFGLAAAIAFGLGCKDMAADFLHNLFKGR